jgi:hypothetical protein
MKTLLALLVSIVMIDVAQARSPRLDIQSAQLTRLNIDPKNQFLSSERLDGTGLIVVNQTTREITLQLNRKWSCPTGHACPTVMPEPLLVTLKNLTVSHGFCGGTIYQASEDKRPVDGALQTLTVMDNTTLLPACGANDHEPTEISYETESGHMGGNVIETHSTFTAEKLSY